MRALRPSALLLLLLLACRTVAPVPSSQDLPPCPAFAGFARDWSRFPAVVSLDSFRGRLYVVGDVHGMLAEFQESLLRAGLVVREGSAFAWSGGDAVLIQVGDLVNKGPHSLAAIDFVEALAVKAQAAGGRVVVLAGNHEIGTLAKGHLRFYAPIREEALARGLDLCRDVLDPRSRYGAWLRTRPAAAFVNGLYVSHAGNSQGRTREDVEAFYRDLVDRADWSSRHGCGDSKARPPISGFFNHDVWWGPRGERFEAGRQALGVRQFLFGNDPTAFLAKGEVVGYFATPDGRALVKLDVGTVYGHSRGVILRCTEWLEGGGCARFERLVNPASPEAPAAFEPVPLHDLPPEQPEPEIKPWGC